MMVHIRKYIRYDGASGCAYPQIGQTITAETNEKRKLIKRVGEERWIEGSNHEIT